MSTSDSTSQISRFAGPAEKGKRKQTSFAVASNKAAKLVQGGHMTKAKCQISAGPDAKQPFADLWLSTGWYWGQNCGAATCTAGAKSQICHIWLLIALTLCRTSSCQVNGCMEQLQLQSHSQPSTWWGGKCKCTKERVPRDTLDSAKPHRQERGPFRLLTPTERLTFRVS